MKRAHLRGYSPSIHESPALIQYNQARHLGVKPTQSSLDPFQSRIQLYVIPVIMSCQSPSELDWITNPVDLFSPVHTLPRRVPGTRNDPSDERNSSSRARRTTGSQLAPLRPELGPLVTKMGSLERLCVPLSGLSQCLFDPLNISEPFEH